MDPVTQPVSDSSPSGPPAHIGPDVDLTGQTIGDFQILRRLGQGGMGQVFLAEQLSLKRKVALKIMKGDLSAKTNALKRFRAEAEAVARATHANIVQVYAIGETNGLNYMALEYVDGRNLRQYLERKGTPELMLALSIMRQVAAALQRASELGIIHRDIKPENILLTRKGEVKVADFGLSRVFADDQQPLNLTQTGVTMGTPLYMSPEQVENKSVDPRTDIYSFGVTCYHMLAGAPPFRGESPLEVAIQHIVGQAKPLAEIRPDLPKELCAIVHKMMSRAPADRYQTGREVLKDLGQLRDSLAGQATSQVPQSVPLQLAAKTLPIQQTKTPTRPAFSPAKPAWRPSRMIIAVSAALALLAGGLWGWSQNWSNTNDLSPKTKQTKLPKNLDPLLAPVNIRNALLVAEMKKQANPGQDRDRIVRGLKIAVQLSLLYLHEWRLDEAAKLFKDLGNPDRPKAYQVLGQLGEAIVLSFKDQYAESNRLFVKMAPSFRTRGPRLNFNESDKAWFFFVTQQHREFRRMIGQALDRNYENNPEGFPPELQQMRQPPDFPNRPKKKKN